MAIGEHTTYVSASLGQGKSQALTQYVMDMFNDGPIRLGEDVENDLLHVTHADRSTTGDVQMIRLGLEDALMSELTSASWNE